MATMQDQTDIYVPIDFVRNDGKVIATNTTIPEFLERYESDLFDMNLSGLDLLANFNNVSARGADFSETKVLDAIPFRNSDFANANFRGAVLPCANFQGSDLQNVDFSHANLWCANFTDCNLSSANFKYAYIRWTSFVNATMGLTKWQRNPDFPLFNNALMKSSRLWRGLVAGERNFDGINFIDHYAPEDEFEWARRFVKFRGYYPGASVDEFLRAVDDGEETPEFGSRFFSMPPDLSSAQEGYGNMILALEEFMRDINDQTGIPAELFHRVHESWTIQDSDSFNLSDYAGEPDPTLPNHQFYMGETLISFFDTMFNQDIIVSVDMEAGTYDVRVGGIDGEIETRSITDSGLDNRDDEGVFTDASEIDTEKVNTDGTTVEADDLEDLFAKIDELTEE